jgi:hypothetical protein
MGEATMIAISGGESQSKNHGAAAFLAAGAGFRFQI